MITTNVNVRGSTNAISNKYSINCFYYSIGNHTQRKFQYDYKLLSYSNNVNTCKCCQVFMIITYVNNKSSFFHSTGVSYTIWLGYESAKHLLYQGLFNTNLD